MTATMLPADTHVHSEWSWDAPGGSMESTCQRAIEVGLPAIAFTEHVDLTPWTVGQYPALPEGWNRFVADGVLTPPELDLHGYLQSVDGCRRAFSELRILSGVELSEPHWHPVRTREFLQAGRFDHVISSVHASPVHGGAFGISALFEAEEPDKVMRNYLAEVIRMIEAFDVAVLGHIDYPARYWPTETRPYDPSKFEDEYRAVLTSLARCGGTLEINTRVPLDPRIVTWWVQAGGHSVTFGSDAHEPAGLAHGLAAAAEIAAAAGFTPGSAAHEPWHR